MEKYNIEPYNNEESYSDYRKEEAYIRAKKKVDAIIGFYWHLAAYLVVNIFLVLLIGLNSNQGFTGFGTYATAFFWGIGLLFHFLGVFGPTFMFGNDWENRKIKEFMDKDKEQFRKFE